MADEKKRTPDKMDDPDSDATGEVFLGDPGEDYRPVKYPWLWIGFLVFALLTSLWKIQTARHDAPAKAEILEINTQTEERK